MRKILAVFMSLVLTISIASASGAFEIVLPDDVFEEEVTFARGDVNGDGRVDLNDYTFLGRIINGATVAIGGDADVDVDGTISLNDFAKLSRILNGAVGV